MSSTIPSTTTTSSIGATASSSSSCTPSHPFEIDHKHCFEASHSSECALILLNTPSSFASLARVWKAAAYRVAADGASNRLYFAVKQHAELLHQQSGGTDHSSSSTAFSSPMSSSSSSSASTLLPPPPSHPVHVESLLQQFLPDLICGDWDSIEKEVEEFYARNGVKMISDPDQDSTDLMKCMHKIEQMDWKQKKVKEESNRNEADDDHHKQQQGEEGREGKKGDENDAKQLRVIVYGAFGGRFDQEAQNFNTLYTWQGRFKQLTLLSEDCLASLLPAGTSHVRISPPYEGPTIGLIPLGQPVRSLTTKGLHWDVTDWDCSFGTRMSTSNRVEHYPTIAKGRYNSSNNTESGSSGSNGSSDGNGDAGAIPDVISASASSNNSSTVTVEEDPIVIITTSEPIIWTANVNMK